MWQENDDEGRGGAHDAATCLLTLHFVAEDAKLAARGSIRQRLKPGAPFAVVDLCIDKSAPDMQAQLDRYIQFAVGSGADLADMTKARTGVETMLPCLSPEREEALLREAGFSSIALFFAGLYWRGWIGHA